jgi:hypothetical protein
MAQILSRNLSLKAYVEIHFSTAFRVRSDHSAEGHEDHFLFPSEKWRDDAVRVRGKQREIKIHVGDCVAWWRSAVVAIQPTAYSQFDTKNYSRSRTSTHLLLFKVRGPNVMNELNHKIFHTKYISLLSQASLHISDNSYTCSDKNLVEILLLWFDKHDRDVLKIPQRWILDFFDSSHFVPIKWRHQLSLQTWLHFSHDHLFFHSESSHFHLLSFPHWRSGASVVSKGEVAHSIPLVVRHRLKFALVEVEESWRRSH